MPLSIASNKSTSSLRGFLMSRSTSTRSKPVSKPAFCEIFVPGYGNGLNEAKLAKPDDTGAESEAQALQPHESTPPSNLVSRESSKSSGYSRSTDTDDDIDDITEMDHLSIGDETSHTLAGNLKVMDVDNEMREIHFNTATWDSLLED